MTKLAITLRRLLSQRALKGILAITLPLIFQSIIFRKRGSYAYRILISLISIFITTMYGTGLGLVLTILGRNKKGSKYVFDFHAKLVQKLLGLNAIVEGKENLLNSNQSVIYVCNHQTMMDFHFMSFAFPEQASVIVKKSVKYYPFFGQFLMLFKTIFMNRGNQGDAIEQARQAANEMLRKSTSVYAFPEGTRAGVQNVDLLPFKKGAFYMATQAKVPIVPIVIGNYKHIYNPNRRHFSPGFVKIRVLPPISTKDVPKDSESVNKLMNRVRAEMLVALREMSLPHKKNRKVARAKI